MGCSFCPSLGRKLLHLVDRFHDLVCEVFANLNQVGELCRATYVKGLRRRTIDSTLDVHGLEDELLHAARRLGLGLRQREQDESGRESHAPLNTYGESAGSSDFF